MGAGARAPLLGRPPAADIMTGIRGGAHSHGAAGTPSSPSPTGCMSTRRSPPSPTSAPPTQPLHPRYPSSHALGFLACHSRPYLPGPAAALRSLGARLPPPPYPFPSSQWTSFLNRALHRSSSSSAASPWPSRLPYFARHGGGRGRRRCYRRHRTGQTLQTPRRRPAALAPPVQCAWRSSAVMGHRQVRLPPPPVQCIPLTTAATVTAAVTAAAAANVWSPHPHSG